MSKAKFEVKQKVLTYHLAASFVLDILSSNLVFSLVNIFYKSMAAFVSAADTSAVMQVEKTNGEKTEMVDVDVKLGSNHRAALLVGQLAMLTWFAPMSFSANLGMAVVNAAFNFLVDKDSLPDIENMLPSAPSMG